MNIICANAPERDGAGGRVDEAFVEQDDAGRDDRETQGEHPGRSGSRVGQQDACQRINRLMSGVPS